MSNNVGKVRYTRMCGPTFFKRFADQVAPNLLGKFLVRRYGGKTRVYMITDVEAYDGFHDKASHASRGKTARNAPMFGPAGYWYVYFTYGMHWMLNIVTGKEEYPAAVLIRGVEGIKGPARITKTLHVDKKLNGARASRSTGLWIEDRGVRIPRSKIKTAPRIGVAYAGSTWSRKKLRFFLERV